MSQSNLLNRCWNFTQSCVLYWQEDTAFQSTLTNIPHPSPKSLKKILSNTTTQSPVVPIKHQHSWTNTIKHHHSPIFPIKYKYALFNTTKQEHSWTNTIKYQPPSMFPIQHNHFNIFGFSMFRNKAVKLECPCKWMEPSVCVRIWVFKLWTCNLVLSLM